MRGRDGAVYVCVGLKRAAVPVPVLDSGSVFLEL